MKLQDQGVESHAKQHWWGWGWYTSLENRLSYREDILSVRKARDPNCQCGCHNRYKGHCGDKTGWGSIQKSREHAQMGWESKMRRLKQHSPWCILVRTGSTGSKWIWVQGKYFKSIDSGLRTARVLTSGLRVLGAWISYLGVLLSLNFLIHKTLYRCYKNWVW